MSSLRFERDSSARARGYPLGREQNKDQRPAGQSWSFQWWHLAAVFLAVSFLLPERAPALERTHPGTWTQSRAGHTPGRMKGVFIGRLAGYVTWPKTAFKNKDEKIRVVFVGEDTDGVEQGFRGEVIVKKNRSRAANSGGRYFSAQHLVYAPEARDPAGKRSPTQSKKRLALEKAIREAHAVYISSPKPGAVRKAEEKSWTQDLLRLAAKESQLTLGESKEFCEWGGMVRFFVSKEQTLSFEVNLPPMREHKLSIHSRLLDFARKTYR